MDDEKYRTILKGVGFFMGMYLSLFTLLYGLVIRHESNQGTFVILSAFFFIVGMTIFFTGGTKGIIGQIGETRLGKGEVVALLVTVVFVVVGILWGYMNPAIHDCKSMFNRLVKDSYKQSPPTSYESIDTKCGLVKCRICWKLGEECSVMTDYGCWITI